MGGLLIMFVLLVGIINSSAQVYGITDDGKEVKLNPNRG